MHLAHVVKPHPSRQNTGAFHCQMVGEYFHLDIRAHDRVVAMCDGIDDDLGPAKFRIVRYCAENGPFTKECMFPYLSFHKFKNFASHVNDPPFKYLVFHDVHLGTGKFLRAFISNDSDPSTLEQLLRILRKKQHGRATDDFTTVFFHDKVLIGAEIGHRVVQISNKIAILCYILQIKIVNFCTNNGLILEILHSLRESQLHSFFETQLPRPISNSQIRLVGRRGMDKAALLYV